MGEVEVEEAPAGPTATAAVTKPLPSRPRLSVLPLIALIFYDVSGGPFGVEDSVRAGGGPLLSLLGFIVLPIFWSLPEALITAELAASFPENGGYVVWVSAAFGPFWAFQEGFWKWASGTLDNALYPVLFLDYITHSLSFFARSFCLVLLTAALTYLNYRGLHLVGLSAIVLTAFSLSPFIAMAFLAIPRIRPNRWIKFDRKRLDLRAYFNNMFWNLNYWDKASTLAGEVDNPSRTFPKAIFGAVVLVVLSYAIPLLAGTGALDETKTGEWTDGYFSQVGFEIGGTWLKLWIQAAAAMSNMGLFEAEMSCDSFQLLGMSEMGMFPAIFAKRSKYGTPTYSILLSATGVIILSCMNFQEIIEFLNFLYALGMLLEFAAFIKLRIKKPDLHRPYKIPVNTIGAVVICIPPTVLLVLVMCLASIRTLVVTGSVMIFGFVLYFLFAKLKEREWVEFLTTPLEKTEIDEEACASLLLEGSSVKKDEPLQRETDSSLEGIIKIE
ncbi:Amino acid permease family protein [Rhynchospora pubera]|uniref:Polyamine transporter PUT1 n=1 Tax=Rhynchospora pubera TaxID=906938 RepID=A0AAV8GLN8_9POAL|nr:Amino acid permease family protein [Rhynchospora pubera]